MLSCSIGFRPKRGTDLGLAAPLGLSASCQELDYGNFPVPAMGRREQLVGIARRHVCAPNLKKLREIELKLCVWILCRKDKGDLSEQLPGVERNVNSDAFGPSL